MAEVREVRYITRLKADVAPETVISPASSNIDTDDSEHLNITIKSSKDGNNTSHDKQKKKSKLRFKKMGKGAKKKAKKAKKPTSTSEILVDSNSE